MALTSARIVFRKVCGKCRQEKPLEEFPRRFDAPNATHRSNCKSCHYAKTKAWNPEKLRQMQDAWRKRNRPRVNAQMRERAHKNPAAIAAGHTRWRLRHQPECAERGRRRYASKMNACPAWADKDAIKAFYVAARWLTRKTGIAHAVDHIVPIKSDIVCGLHVAANLQVLTKSDNSRKKNRFWPDMP